MKIITTADDFGYDSDTVAATSECLISGALTSATIMPKMPATEEAVEFALQHPQYSFGVHLTFVCDTVEAPVSPPERVPALLRSDGRFLPSQTVRKMALLGRLPVDQIKIEAAAQIDLLLAKGIRVSHVDSHGHLHKFAPFRRTLVDVMRERGLRRVRSVQDIYLKRPLMSPTYWMGLWWRKKIMASFATADHFYMCTSAQDQGWPEALLRRTLTGTIEVGVHPGYSEDWRKREHLAIQEFSRLARDGGHELVGWSEV